MFSSLTLSRPLIISLAVVSTIGVVSAAFFQFSGTAGTPHSLGQFSITNIGNAGTISFEATSPCNIPTTEIAGLNNQNLTGKFCLETVGVVSFMPGAHITPPSSGRPTDLWGVSGTASGTYCGAIDLTGVQYNPATRSLIGYGMNDGVGRVPFGIAGTAGTDPITGLPVAPPDSITSTTVSAGFEGRVKILGNIGGNSAFNSLNALGSSFNASLMNDTLQKVRKNVALLTRNVTLSTIPKTVNNTIFIKDVDAVYSAIRASTSFPNNSVDSLIIIGGDLIIDDDIINNYAKPKGIIVLKNEAGVGGNIIVTNTVKKIESSIFTEGSLYSGTDLDNNGNNLYNNTTAEIATLGENQLYIRGSLISRNTIGGSFTTLSPTCVYGETTATCTPERSIQYDLNYFRQTPPTRSSTAPTTRSYGDSSLDSYSLIIELDPRLATTPPPGF